MITEVLYFVCSCSQQVKDDKETPGLSSFRDHIKVAGS